MNIPQLVYHPVKNWPVDTVVLFMAYAADDSIRFLWWHYEDIEQWIKGGRVGPKPQLQTYERE